MFCFVAMPFGLKNAGATYQRLVDKIFRHQLGRNMEVYVDGMLVKVKEAHNHAEDLEETFAVLRKYRLKLNIGKCAFGVRRTFSGIYGDPTRENGRAQSIHLIINRKGLAFFKTLRKAIPRETLYLYISSTSQAVSSVSSTKEDGTQTPIYYVSKLLNGAKCRYPSLEKMALALVITARKLLPYFLSYLVGVVTITHLKQVLGKPEEEVSKERPWLLHVDGSSTTQGSGAGVVITSPQEEDMEFAIKFDFKASNNETEYEALVLGMRMALDAGALHLIAYCDSQMIVKQVSGEYEANEESMIQYLQQIEELKTKFKSFQLQQIQREENVKADSLSKLASALEDCKTRRIIVQHLLYPRVPLNIQATTFGGRP
ncbi:UNVERIFIED_CONTAM: Retrovirus-related Pol polyprotein from transposon opus [Sesamum angustifolium]|uniref:Retrovirus-related Pol polyprotein from transposon opus n=1 Tax=Sesamum angustifolium TaxID=2727405 RepID=A0AAW2IX47_9LAMI